MRLILSGGGAPETVIPLDELFVNQIDLQKIVLYIPVAWEDDPTYIECLDWFKRTYQPYGIENIEMCTNLKSIEYLDQYTAIFIGGGNTFKLLKEIKESNFDLKLVNYLNCDGLLYGGSAGAIICGRTIEVASYLDKNNVGLTDFTGLNLAAGKDIFCHYNNSTSENEFIENHLNDLYILYEESGLFIQDNKIKSVGKKFLCKNIASR